MIMKIFRVSFLLLILGVTGLLTVGCGESGGPDPKIEQARVDEAVEMRKLFDKVGGDYSKLDASDKAKFEKYVGKPAEAEKTWNSMKYGSAGDVSAPPSGAGQ
jgi:hypothetical protein